MSIDTFLLSSDTTDLNYPEVRPTLDLNFARVKALDPRITFTRSSGGSYVGADGLIKYAGVNEARFDHDPYTGESLGFLVEEARTNLVLRSEEFDAAGWPKSNATITANATTAPDGTTTADKFVVSTDAASTRHDVQQGLLSTTNSIITFSVFLKAGEKTVCIIRLYGIAISCEALVNLSSGTIAIVFASNVVSTATSISRLANGWFRCSVTAQNTGTGLAGASVFEDSVGDGISGIFIWGAQVEAGAFPTSYIPTEASTRTRADDVASITGTNFSSWFNQNNGTLLCQAQNLNAEPNPPLTLTATPYYQGVGGYKLGLGGFWSSVSQLSTDAWANGVALGGSSINVSETQAASATIRHSFAYSPTECRACVKQTLGTLGGSQCFQAAQGLDQLLLRQYFGGHFSRISRITYYPVRLPDAQLQALTR